jgi:hypothetical protein
MSTKILVTGGDLLHIAAVAYNNPQKWVFIAQANRLDDAFITETMFLTIPDDVGFDTGGLPIQ